MDFELLDAAFCHLVLPPKLPQEPDGKATSSLIRYLEQRLQQACGLLRNIGDPRAWDTLDASLRAARVLDQGALSKRDLLQTFIRMTREDAREWLWVGVAGQDAALLIHHAQEYADICPH